jgi:hypothetical protein
MKSYRLGLDGDTAYPPSLLCSRTVVKHADGYPKIRCGINATIIRGQLIVQTNKLIISAKKSSQGVTALPKVLEFLMSHHGQGWCCAHQDWTLQHPDIIKQSRLDQPSQERHVETASSRLKDVAVGNNKSTFKFYQERSYPYCYTDVVFRHLDHPSLGRMIGFTTWKDLGRGETIRDPKWISHLYHASPTLLRRAVPEEHLHRDVNPATWRNDMRYSEPRSYLHGAS